jgi:hypothetical protein
MIDWTRAQLDAAGLHSGEPGRVEPLSADIRTPLASAYVDLFLRADLAIQLLDALWLQGELTDAGHAERTGAMRRAPLSVLGAIQRRMRGAGRASRRCIDSVMRGRVGGVSPGSGAWEGLELGDQLVELVPGARAQEPDQLRQVVIRLVQVGDRDIQFRGQPLCRLQVRHMLAPLVLVDPRTGDELVDPGQDAELLLRYALASRAARSRLANTDFSSIPVLRAED